MPEGFSMRLSEPTATASALCGRLLEAARVQEAVRVWGKTNATDETFASDLETGIDRAEQWLAADTGEGFLDARFEAGPFLEGLLAFPPSSDKYRAKKPDADAFAAWRVPRAYFSRSASGSQGARVSVAAVSLARLLEDAYAQAEGRPTRSGRFAAPVLGRVPPSGACPSATASGSRSSWSTSSGYRQAAGRRYRRPGAAKLRQRLCTVGDAQQSIYRFRGADVNVFFEYRDRLRSLSPEAEFPQLPHNFRSHGDVLSLVDAVFGQPQVFGDEFLHLEAAGAVNTAADPVFEGDGPARIAVSVFQNDGSRATVSSEELSARCAREVAERFAQLREAGARPGEMALLLGTMTRASVYQEALRDAGFESIVTGGSGFGQSAEAQLVATLLRVAVNRDDSEALYQALASDLFALSDDALLALATTDAWASESDGEGDDGRARPRQPISRGFFGREEDEGFPLGENDRAALALARRCLRDFVRRAVREEPALALRRLFVDSGLADRLQLEGADGMARAGNFNKACVVVGELARESCGIADVARQFADYLSLAKEAPGALACLDADFVRIMTVHTSKGLELPHVAVAELKDGYPGGRAPSFFVENIGETTYVAATWMPHGLWDKTASKLKGWARAQEAEDLDVSLDGPAEAERAFGALSAAQFGAALAAYSAAQEREEARRLMYVALTRASRSLLLAMRVSAKVEDGYESTWVTGDVFDALGWAMDDGASVAMMDFGGRAPARVASERVLAEVGEETGEEPLAASAPTGEERLDEELGAAASLSEDAPAVFAVVRRAHGEDPALASHNFAQEGCAPTRRFRARIPMATSRPLRLTRASFCCMRSRSGLGSGVMRRIFVR